MSAIAKSHKASGERLSAGRYWPPFTAASLFLLLAVLLLVAMPALAQVQAPTRVTTYDWQCQDATGAKLSDHQRFDTAFIACLNNPAGDRVQGGTYKLNKSPAPATGSATLRWTPPTQNSDGSALTDLAGYRIVYGTSATQLTQMVQVSNASLSSYVIEGLPPGTYYFAVRAYTSAGAESVNSSLATKVIS